jgi:hypothetical protein
MTIARSFNCGLDTATAIRPTGATEFPINRTNDMGESEIQPSRWDGIASPRIPAVETAGYLQMFLWNKTAPSKWRKQ